MLVKFISENQIITENKNDILFYDDIQVINPKEEDFIKAGYKELIIEDKPIHNNEEEFLTEYFEETTDNVIKKWTINKRKENQEG